MSRAKNAPSIYTPLAKKGEIRLLRFVVDLRNGGGQDRDTSPIVCQLQATKISEPSACPAYTALSYTWGPTEPERFVSINESRLKITPNLDVALRHMQNEWLASLAVDFDNSRWPHGEDGESVVKSEWFWIDAICINQSDRSEKETQVPQMKEIYECAEKVLVWLGDIDSEMEILAKLLGPIGKEAVEIGVLDVECDEMMIWPNFKDADRVEKLRPVREKLDGLIRRVTRGDLGNGSFPLTAFVRLTQSEWFSRVWVLQELAVARRVVFARGDMRVDEKEFTAAMIFCSLWIIDQIQYLAAVFLFGWRWEIITELWNWWRKNGWEFFRVFYAKASPDARPFHTLQMRKDYRTIEKKETLSLDRLLVRCFSQDRYGLRIGATDPRDRIYALYNLSSDKPGAFSKFDYQNDCAVTYIKVAKAMLEAGHVDILSLSRRTQRQDIPADPSKAPQNLSSWVPDWYRLVPKPWCGRKEDGLFHTNSRAEVNVSFHESNKRMLCLEARRVGTVSEISENKWDGEAFPEWDLALAHKVVLEVEAFVQKSTKYSATEKTEAMWRIPICDKEHNNTGGLQRATDASLRAYSSFKDVMSQPAKPPPVHLNQPHSPYLTMMSYLYGSSTFMSDNGFVGLCPADTAASDVICAPSGAHLPYVLRRNESNRWELIGEAFVYGIMDGIDGEVFTTAENFEIE